MITIIILFGLIQFINAQDQLDELLPVRGLCISAPAQEDLDQFISFINDELIPLKVNTMVIRISYNYQYESHPELRSEHSLSKPVKQGISGLSHR